MMKYISMLFCIFLCLCCSAVTAADVYDQYMHALYYESRGDYNTAYGIYSKIKDQYDDPQVLLKTAYMKHELGDVDGAYNIIVSTCNKYPGNETVLFAAGGFAEAQAQQAEDQDTRKVWLDRAAVSFQKALEIDKSEKNYIALAHIYTMQDRESEAIKIYNILIDSGREDYCYITGRYLYQKGEVEAAEKELNRAAALNNPQALLLLADIAIKAKDEKTAVMYLEKIHSFRPDMIEVSILLAEIAQDKKKYHEAIEYYADAVNYADDTVLVELYNRIGSLSAETENYEMALEAYLEILTIDESEPKFFYMAAYLAGMKDPVNAEEIYLRGLELYPDYAVLRKNAAANYIDMHKPDKALEMLDKIDPIEQDVTYFRILGHTYNEMKRKDKAEEVYKNALAENPGSLELILPLADLYFENKKYNECTELLEKTIKIEKNSPILQNYIAYLYAVQGVKLKEANILVDKALKQDPENYAYVDTKAWVLYKMGNYKEAFKYIKQAKQLVENNEEVLQHYKEIEEKLKK